MAGLAADKHPQIRFAFIWASENIATETPDAYAQNLSLFAEASRQRRQSENGGPEMFRVMGKRRPQLVVPYFPILQELSENDPNPVVSIHSAGAIRVTNSQLK